MGLLPSEAANITSLALNAYGFELSDIMAFTGLRRLSWQLHDDPEQDFSLPSGLVELRMESSDCTLGCDLPIYKATAALAQLESFEAIGTDFEEQDFQQELSPLEEAFLHLPPSLKRLRLEYYCQNRSPAFMQRPLQRLLEREDWLPALGELTFHQMDEDEETDASELLGIRTACQARGVVFSSDV